MKNSVKFGKKNFFRNSSTLLAMPKCPAVFELCRRKTTSRQSVFGTQNCLYFTLPQSSEKKLYKKTFSTTRRLNCFRYFCKANGNFGESRFPLFSHETTSRIISSFCCSWTKSRGCVRFGKSFKLSSKSLVSIKFICGNNEKVWNPVIIIAGWLLGCFAKSWS